MSQALMETVHGVIEMLGQDGRRLTALENDRTRRLNNLKGTAAPGATDDADSGYSSGSIWIDGSVSPANAYICIGNTVGAAVWSLIASGGGGLGGRGILAKAANYTVLAADIFAGGWLTIVADATASAFTLTLLPLASAYDAVSDTGSVINITRRNAGGNIVTVDGDGAETINGQLTILLGKQYSNIQLQAGPTEWVIL